MRALHLDGFSGVAGDMLVGALLDLGASFEAVEEGISRLGVDGFRLAAGPVDRGPIRSTKFDVILDAAAHGHSHGHDSDGHHAPHRGLREIRQILNSSSLSEPVRRRALAAFELLARAEGKIHGKDPEDVHFHEVGAVDAICDIVGASIALDDLGVDRVFVGPLHVGSGFVTCAHGTIPVPAPATLECLRGFDIVLGSGPPGTDLGELVTPTGACLVATFGEPGVPPAPFRVSRIGYGAGTRNPVERPNVLRAILGEIEETPAEAIVELATNVDHVAPTMLAAALTRILESGARDAYVAPCTMKKGRSGHVLVALVDESERAAVEGVIFEETGTLGIRRHTVERTVLRREFVSVQTPWGPVRVKLGHHGGKVTSRVPEFEECRALAREHGVAVAAVTRAAAVRAAEDVRPDV